MAASRVRGSGRLPVLSVRPLQRRRRSCRPCRGLPRRDDDRPRHRLAPRRSVRAAARARHARDDGRRPGRGPAPAQPRMSLRASRAAAQLLHRPAELGAVELVRRLLAVQAQELRSARLALRARDASVAAADIDAALTAGELVVAWLQRGTLHLVAADDHGWLLALTAPTRMSTSARRLGQEGVPPDDADRAVAIIERALADEAPPPRPELADRVAAHGIRTEGQATPHLLMLAALRGVAVLGPMRGERQAFVLARDWVGGRPGRPPPRRPAPAPPRGGGCPPPPPPSAAASSAPGGPRGAGLGWSFSSRSRPPTPRRFRPRC